MQEWRIFRVIFIGLLLHIYAGLSAQTALQPVLAPDFKLPSLQGDSMELKSYRGKIVLINFWASWCVPCRAENRKFAKRYAKLKTTAFEMISISVDADRKKWKQAVERDGMIWPQLIDDPTIKESVAARWGAATLPASFLVDTKGRIIVTDAALLLIHDLRGFKTAIRNLAN